MMTQRLSVTILAFLSAAVGGAVVKGANPGDAVASTLFTTFSAKINFQPATASIPAGYLLDSGQVYGPREGGLSYGWNKDNRANTRNRNSPLSPDQRFDTFIYTRSGEDVFQWELGVPNGTYRVHVVAGDADAFQSFYGIDVEGVKAISDSPTLSKRWLEATVTVKVSDGRLTVANRPEAKDNTICFIEVQSEGVSPTPSISAVEVRIVSPSDNAAFLNPKQIELTATATSRGGRIKAVEFFEGRQSLGVAASNPLAASPVDLYRLTWPTPKPGIYTLTAKATDTLGNSATSPLVGIVVNSSDAKEATLVINRPTDGASFTPATTIPIQATAIDPSGYINHVEFFAGDNRIGVSELTFIRAPTPGEPIFHSFEWKNVAAGTYALTARAKDSKGIAVASKPVTINVKAAPLASFVTRQLPASYSPGAPFTVELQAKPPDGTKAYAVEDQLPTGWSNVAKITSDGVYDGANGKVKFGPFFDTTARTLTYDVTPPSGATGEKIFQGSAAADGKVSAIGGASRIDAALLHPADNNPANNEISLNEVTAYAAAWRNGASWPIDPNPIPISYVTRAGALWRGGEAYAYDAKAGPAPNGWVNVAKPPPKTGIGKQSLERNSAQAEFSAIVPGEGRNRIIRVKPVSGMLSLAVEDQVPAGWSVARISDDGVFDEKGRKVKWGPFYDNAPRTLSYEATPPSSPISLAFAATASFDGVDVTVANALPHDSGFFPGLRSVRAIRRLSTGEVEITFPAEPGQTYSIETSRDLIEWAELRTVPADKNEFQFRDGTDQTMNQRFYRVRPVAPKP